MLKKKNTWYWHKLFSPTKAQNPIARWRWCSNFLWATKGFQTISEWKSPQTTTTDHDRDIWRWQGYLLNRYRQLCLLTNSVDPLHYVTHVINPTQTHLTRYLSIINWVDNVNWPPLRVLTLKFRALALRQSEWRNCGLCVRLYAENG